MTDIVSRQKRREMMAGIRAKNTRPELILRKLLHRAGFRYKLHVSNLPGKPDLVLPKYKAVIFVNGCFWHRHTCHLFRLPKTRTEFWDKKLDSNKDRDARNILRLRDTGWRVLLIWECAIKGKSHLGIEDIEHFSTSWLRSNSAYGSLSCHGMEDVLIGERTSGT